jgi:bacteriocin biosynthesis cyclodehydratase domain-containing protein
MYANDLQYIRVSNEKAVLKRGANELMLSGGDVHVILEQLIGKLDGRSREEIVDSFAEELRPEIDALLTSLLARRLITEEPEPRPAEITLESLQSAFWWSFGKPAEQATEKLRAATIIVAGATLIARSLIRSLLESGIGRVVIVDHPVLNNEAAPSRFDFASDARVSRQPELPADDELAAASLICATSDLAAQEALLDINRAAIRVRRPFLPVSVGDLAATIGPLNEPGETACLRCYLIRTDANNVNYAAARALRLHIREHPETALATGVLPPMTGIAGEIAALEVIKYIAGFPPPDAIGRAIQVNLVSFAAVARRVLKIPRCPDCSDVMVRATRAVTTAPLIPYTES